MAKTARADNARLNQLRAQQAAAEKRRRLTIAVAAVIGIVAVVAVLVLVALFGPKSGPIAATALDDSTYKTLTSVPASAFDQVGLGDGVSNPPTTISGSALTQDGKPRVLYVGAEYCPFCAAQRWPLVVALARFGQFSGLQAAYSAPAPETNPNTATLGFHGASYTSQYLAFTGVETQDSASQPLDTLSADDQKLFSTYNPKGGIPFIDYGGKRASNGASIDTSIFAGKSQADIAAAINDPSSTIGKAVLGSANVISAQLCQLTNNQPAAVCSSSGVTTAAASLK